MRLKKRKKRKKSVAYYSNDRDTMVLLRSMPGVKALPKSGKKHQSTAAERKKVRSAMKAAKAAFRKKMGK